MAECLINIMNRQDNYNLINNLNIFAVIPAKAGNQFNRMDARLRTSGMTDKEKICKIHPPHIDNRCGLISQGVVIVFLQHPAILKDILVSSG